MEDSTKIYRSYLIFNSHLHETSHHLPSTPPPRNSPCRGEGAYPTRSFNQSASTRRARRNDYFVLQGLTDLIFANAKDLIQSRRIQIRVASLSLVSFRSLSVLSAGRLISNINLYHLFAEHYISFFLQFRVGWSFVFGGKIWHFQIRRWRNLDLTKYFAEDWIQYWSL